MTSSSYISNVFEKINVNGALLAIILYACMHSFVSFSVRLSYFSASCNFKHPYYVEINTACMCIKKIVRY